MREFQKDFIRPRVGQINRGQSINLALRCFEWAAENGFHGSERINGSSTSTQRNWLASGLK